MSSEILRIPSSSSLESLSEYNGPSAKPKGIGPALQDLIHRIVTWFKKIFNSITSLFNKPKVASQFPQFNSAQVSRLKRAKNFVINTPSRVNKKAPSPSRSSSPIAHATRAARRDPAILERIPTSSSKILINFLTQFLSNVTQCSYETIDGGIQSTLKNNKGLKKLFAQPQGSIVSIQEIEEFMNTLHHFNSPVYSSVFKSDEGGAETSHDVSNLNLDASSQDSWKWLLDDYPHEQRRSLDLLNERDFKKHVKEQFLQIIDLDHLGLTEVELHNRYISPLINRILQNNGPTQMDEEANADIIESIYHFALKSLIINLEYPDEHLREQVQPDLLLQLKRILTFFLERRCPNLITNDLIENTFSWLFAPGKIRKIGINNVILDEILFRLQTSETQVPLVQKAIRRIQEKLLVERLDERNINHPDLVTWCLHSDHSQLPNKHESLPSTTVLAIIEFLTARKVKHTLQINSQLLGSFLGKCLVRKTILTNLKRFSLISASRSAAMLEEVSFEKLINEIIETTQLHLHSMLKAEENKEDKRIANEDAEKAVNANPQNRKDTEIKADTEVIKERVEKRGEEGYLTDAYLQGYFESFDPPKDKKAPQQIPRSFDRLNGKAAKSVNNPLWKFLKGRLWFPNNESNPTSLKGVDLFWQQLSFPPEIENHLLNIKVLIQKLSPFTPLAEELEKGVEYLFGLCLKYGKSKSEEITQNLLKMLSSPEELKELLAQSIFPLIEREIFLYHVRSLFLNRCENFVTPLNNCQSEDQLLNKLYNLVIEPENTSEESIKALKMDKELFFSWVTPWFHELLQRLINEKPSEGHSEATLKEAIERREKGAPKERKAYTELTDALLKMSGLEEKFEFKLGAKTYKDPFRPKGLSQEIGTLIAHFGENFVSIAASSAQRSWGSKRDVKQLLLGEKKKVGDEGLQSRAHTIALLITDVINLSLSSFKLVRITLPIRLVVKPPNVSQIEDSILDLFNKLFADQTLNEHLLVQILDRVMGTLKEAAVVVAEKDEEHAKQLSSGSADSG